MSLRHLFLLMTLVAASASIVDCLPQVAVWRTILASGIDPSAEPPLTGKLDEAFVESGRFEVLDRAELEQVLKEKGLETSSDLISNDEMRSLGESLGVDFVVVANGSRVGQTYSFSAKMIQVSTGQIAALASKEARGEIDVLLQLANEVGLQLAGTSPTKDATLQASKRGSAAPATYRSSALFLGGVELPGEILIGVSYHFRFISVFGASAFIGYMGFFGTGANANSQVATIGPMITVLPRLDVGVRVGYIRHSYDEYQYPPGATVTVVNYPFGVNPTVLYRFDRFCVGMDAILGVGGTESYYAFAASVGASF